MPRRSPHSSVRIGGYRQLGLDTTPVPKARPRTPRQAERAQPRPPYGRRFHDRLTMLRSALWNNDQPAIQRLEHEIDQLCDAWDRNPSR